MVKAACSDARQRKTGVVVAHSTGTLRIDVRGLSALNHACVGCPDTRRCCCATYEVCVTRAEMRRIVGCLSVVSKFCRHLAGRHGFDNVFDPVDSGLFAIDTDADGLCCFAYRVQGRIRCSLHSAALSLGIPVSVVKPRVCMLWPLALGDGNPASLSVQPDAFAFRCNTRRKVRHDLCGSLAETVKSTFGTQVLQRIESALAGHSGSGDGEHLA